VVNVSFHNNGGKAVHNPINPFCGALKLLEKEQNAQHLGRK
jgi:hypothetical protein